MHEDSLGVYKVVQQLKAEPGARTMALDHKSHTIYTVTAKMGPPPAPTANNPHPYPTIVPNTFVMLMYKR